MIVLDTHVWIWWVHNDAQLKAEHKQLIRDNEASGIIISAISAWEVAKLVEYKRLVLPLPIREWMDQALNYPGMKFTPLTTAIIVDSTELPGSFHKDPA